MMVMNIIPHRSLCIRSIWFYLERHYHNSLKIIDKDIGAIIKKDFDKILMNLMLLFLFYFFFKFNLILKHQWV